MAKKQDNQQPIKPVDALVALDGAVPQALAGAAIVSTAQICKQAQYLSDVAAGVAIGVASEALVTRWWPRRVFG